MSRIPLKNPWALIGLTGILALALVVGGRMGPRPPEVGLIAPVRALPAEVLDEVRLGLGQTFGEVLQAASVGWSDQNALLMAFREQANPRRMIPGTRITFRWLRDQERLRGVDVDLSKDETLRLFRDEAGWSSSLENTPTLVDTLFVSGVIVDNLTNSFHENPDLKAVPAFNREWMVSWMDQIYQWQVDFSRQTRRGDTYRIAIEREVRPDGTMKGGHVIAAEFVNHGTPYLAIWFDPNGDGEGTFYDEMGRSVRRSFLTKPLALGRISSVYSNARLHPIHNFVRAHRGVDYAAASGTPIMATGDGVVIHADWKGELGNLVEIRHPNGWVTRYGHLRAFASGVRPGTRVKQSQTIGYVGMTGGATGPHVHYEMRRRDGSPRDPLDVTALPPGDPIPSNSMGKWALESRQRLRMLERLPGLPIAVLAEIPETDSIDERPAAGGD